MYINQNLTVPEILRKVLLAANQEETLYRYSNSTLKWIVGMFYDKKFHELELPTPFYKASKYPIGNTYSTLTQSKKQIETAIEFYKRGDEVRYDKLMSSVLESIHKDEAILLDKILRNECDALYGIEKKVFRAVYPDLFPKKIPFIGK